MAIEDDILKIQFELGALDDEEGIVKGIASRAVDSGYDNLSPRQKAVLAPYLTQPCEGVIDPAGYHNGCEIQLTKETLRDAYDRKYEFDSLLCQDCIDEKVDLAAQRESFFRE